MTRRCQSCARLFAGDVCPGCGMDHVIHVEVTGAELLAEYPAMRKMAPAVAGAPKVATPVSCEWCAAPMPMDHPNAHKRFCTPACWKASYRPTLDRATLAARVGISLSALYNVARRLGWRRSARGKRLSERPGSGRGTSPAREGL